MRRVYRVLVSALVLQPPLVLQLHCAATLNYMQLHCTVSRRAA